MTISLAGSPHPARWGHQRQGLVMSVPGRLAAAFRLAHAGPWQVWIQDFGGPELDRLYDPAGAVRPDAFDAYLAAAEAYLRGEDTTRFATIAKLKAGRLARQVADTCIQFHGGLGYMEETWTARYFRDSRLLSIGGGADEVMLRVLSRLNGWAE